MGLLIEREEFDEADRARFAARLHEGLTALAALLERPGFGAGPPTLGAELELFLIGAAGRGLPLNRAVLAVTLDPRVTVEVDRFNLEINTRPAPLRGRPFSTLAAELASALAEVGRAVGTHGGR